MARPILIRGARQLLTLHGPAVPRRGSALGELGIIADGAVLIRDGLIQDVGPSRRVEALIEARDAEEISAIGRVVLPGFVDCHTHPVAGPVRPSESGREPPPETYWKIIQQTSQRTLETQCARLLEDFVRHGTTTIEAKSGFGMTERGELKILRTQAALNRRTSMLASTFMATRWQPSASSSPQPGLGFSRFRSGCDARHGGSGRGPSLFVGAPRGRCSADRRAHLARRVGPAHIQADVPNALRVQALPLGLRP